MGADLRYVWDEWRFQHGWDSTIDVHDMKTCYLLHFFLLVFFSFPRVYLPAYSERNTN